MSPSTILDPPGESRPAPTARPAARALPPRRAIVAGPAVAAFTILVALVSTAAVGVSLRDPGGVTARRLATVLVMTLAIAGVDLVVRATLRSAGTWPSRAALAAVRRERWPLRRGLAVTGALVAFYATYLGYRNLKSIVPLVRPGDLFDAQLADADRVLFLGHDPAALLHDLWGIGAATELFSFVYMLFFLFIPLTLGAALVLLPDLRQGFFFVTAMALNWVLGAGSYFLLPALGPIYVDPGAFAGFPDSAATHLQAALLEQRQAFLRDPEGTAQSIGAFASLHTSIFFTAALAAHLLGLGRTVKAVAWILFALTVGATIHLGWHYVVDDLAGMAIAVLALAGACVICGYDPRRAAQRAAR